MTALMIIKYLECCCSRRVSCLKFDAKQSKIQELYSNYLELFGIIWNYFCSKIFWEYTAGTKQYKVVQI